MSDPEATRPTQIDAEYAAKASQAAGIADESAAYLIGQDDAVAKDDDEAADTQPD